MSKLQIGGLTRDYGGGRGIFDLSFSVEPGEVFGFLGPNGAGKTTTIRHLMGFLKPREGSCTIGGIDCWSGRVEIQRGMGYIPGEISFFDDMTGEAYLRFIAAYRGMNGMGRMSELLDMFELDPAVKLKKMSKGMKQKVGIVAAFMHDPAVLILDEPTSGLDPLMQNRFIELVQSERARGKTILMSSHMFDEVERTCHRVAIIKNGRLIAVDSVDALKLSQAKRYIVTLRNAQAAADFAKEPITVLSVVENNVTVTVGAEMEPFLSAMARHPVTNLAAPGQTLEELFMQYYGGESDA